MLETQTNHRYGGLCSLPTVLSRSGLKPGYFLEPFSKTALSRSKGSHYWMGTS